MDDKKAKAILELLSVPNFNQTYILGCFARYVTLYSQQVRALNLVAALNHTGVIQAGSKLIVIGAGASGVTASAAAALLGAEVTLLDELEGAMDLQYNNRQRWIHPYVYDWPDMERADIERPEGNRTHFPVHQLNWTAGYADRVAEQIESGWSSIVQETDRIRCVWRADVSMENYGDQTYVHWHSPDSDPGHEHDAVTILAVGFGLEDEQDWAWSYWSEDDIDGTFRKSAGKTRWLVSGYGDGALTDVMRLCIRRFRHHEIMNLFEKSDHIDGVKRDLREIQEKSKTRTPEWVHDQFVRLATGDLGEKLRTRLRKDGPEVHLTGRSPLIYGPGSSILNRLIVRLLEKLRVVRYVPGETAQFDKGKQIRGGVGAIKVAPGGFLVDLAKPAQLYERVICRHGPSPPPHPRVRESFSAVYQSCAALITTWEKLAPSDDPTRTPNWPADFLKVKRSVEPAINERRRFHMTRKRLGLQAKAMSVSKEIRDDGGSVVSYQIDELSVDKGKIDGLWCRITFSRGVVGVPSLNAAALQLGMKWIPEPRPEPAAGRDTEQVLKDILEQNRQIAGMLKFGKPLRAGDPAINFGFSVEVLNGDALSPWEFQEMYPETARQKHIDQKPIENIEYFARIVWFPVEALHLRLKIPEKIAATPFVSGFECSTPAQDITRGEVAPNSILHLYPGAESALSPKSIDWNRRDYPVRPGEEPLVQTSENRWDLIVRYPPVGSCYSIDFMLNRADGPAGGSLEIAHKALAFRRHLVAAAGPFEHVSTAFRRTIREQLQILNQYAGRYRADPSESFELTFFGYDDNLHRLTTVDGLLDGGELATGMWDFKLPFGVGLGGVTFKMGNRVFLYVRPEDDRGYSGPEYYVDLPRDQPIQVLVSVPLDHPEYRTSIAVERGRQCVGVINILSAHPNSGLKRITENTQARNELWRTCQDFCCAIFLHDQRKIESRTD